MWHDRGAVATSDPSSARTAGAPAPGRRALLDHRFASGTAALETVRREVRAALSAAGCDDEFTETCILAVNEAVTNVVRHGYGPGAEGEIRLSVAVEDGDVVFVLRDFAAAFEPAGTDDSALGELRSGGYGRPLMEMIMDSLQYRRDVAAGANVLEMRKRLDGGAAPEQE